MKYCSNEPDEKWMKMALRQAQIAMEAGEIPIGTVIVKDNQIIASAHNLTSQNPLYHAEKLAIESLLPNPDKFLYDCALYCTIEPCAMCAGIMIWARIGKVVFGAYDDKAGACGSLYNLLQDANMNHNPLVTGGVLADECRLLMQTFFQKKRVSNKKNFTE
jgi:tRNA(adenine34) deaminase